jgi:hypothetical protein
MQLNRYIGEQEVLVKEGPMALDIVQYNVITGRELTSRLPDRACICARSRLNFKEFNSVGFLKGFPELGRERCAIYLFR